MQGKIAALLRTYQPDAVAFGGYGVSPNPLGWVGTESGSPKGEVWSTGAEGVGDPDSPIFCPKTCDTTLQENDKWFWTGNPIRTLHELIDVYHRTVGRNGVLELDFAINRAGLVDESHAARYKELGGWIRTCYGKPVAESAVNGTYAELILPPGAPAVDRVMLQEDLAQGQRVRNYTAELQVPGAGWKVFSQGQSIGNKRIDLGSATRAWSFRLNITNFAGTNGPFITKFAVYQACSAGKAEEIIIIA
ncbi:unnamed protein product [Polarella glacialis]|uniref:Alpha-L-fucosidase n=1 Tax=Polarella glacialis TaxID=89957 RepID=A0A813JHH2_POLGL|nr:unnamed protein product [Polarella glacialis]